MPWMGELRSEVSRLRSAGHEVEPRLTFEAGDALRMARAGAAAGVDLILVAGGDGTVNEVVNGVVQEAWSGSLGIVPLGTGNDFALGLGIPEPVSEAVAAAVSGRDRTVDVPRVNDRRFVNVSTGGFGATATEDTPEETKRLLGPLAYLVTGVQKFTELRPSRARFTSPDGDRYDGDVLLYAVGNGRRTGAGSLVTPRAELDDGELDVVVVPGMTRVDFMALIPRLRAGTHLDHPDVLSFRTDRLVVESEESLSVNADGEALRGDRFRYDMPGDTLTVRVP